MIEILKKIIRKTPSYPPVKESVEAYNLWSAQYDAQPGNLMLDMDEQVFSGLLNGVDLKDKNIADIGCGTGRHWHKLFQQNPASLTGFDVSPGMLRQLNHKFPAANTCTITDNLFSSVPDATFDVIVSTLTVAHIENIAEALQAWCRILKSKGDIIITDFHPDALKFGGKRTFEYQNKQIAVKNFVHGINDIQQILLKHGLHLANSDEKIIDESVWHYYSSKNALPVYEKFKGSKMIYGMHLRRGENGVE